MTIKAFRRGETVRHWMDDCGNEKLTNVADKIFFTLRIPATTNESVLGSDGMWRYDSGRRDSWRCELAICGSA